MSPRWVTVYAMYCSMYWQSVYDKASVLLDDGSINNPPPLRCFMPAGGPCPYTGPIPILYLPYTLDLFLSYTCHVPALFLSCTSRIFRPYSYPIPALYIGPIPILSLPCSGPIPILNQPYSGPIPILLSYIQYLSCPKPALLYCTCSVPGLFLYCTCFYNGPIPFLTLACTYSYPAPVV